MATTVLEVYNAAISLVGGKGRLTSLGDNTKSREECDIWYPIVLDIAQEAGHWPCCRRQARLTLLEERDFTVDWAAGAPDPQYRYSFDLPNDILRPWNLAHYDRFSLFFDPTRSRNVLSTNRAEAVLTYGARQTNPVFWDAGLRMSIIYGLAAMIAMPLTGDRQKYQAYLEAADQQLLQSRAAVGNYDSQMMEVIPEELRARTGYEWTADTRYLYPLGSNFTAAMTNA